MRDGTIMVPNISRKQSTRGSNYIQMQRNKQNHGLSIPKETH
jgi:hypothetical protein